MQNSNFTTTQIAPMCLPINMFGVFYFGVPKQKQFIPLLLWETDDTNKKKVCSFIRLWMTSKIATTHKKDSVYNIMKVIKLPCWLNLHIAKQNKIDETEFR